MTEILSYLYDQQYALCTNHPLSDPEGFIFRLAIIQQAINAIKKMEL